MIQPPHHKCIKHPHLLLRVGVFCFLYDNNYIGRLWGYTVKERYEMKNENDIVVIWDNQSDEWDDNYEQLPATENNIEQYQAIAIHNSIMKEIENEVISLLN